MVRISEDTRLVDQRVMESIVRLRSIEEIQKKERKRIVLPVVTISRQMGTFGMEVAQSLQGMLGPPWRLWDQQLIDAIANHANVRKEMVEALDEHAQGDIETVVKSLLGVGGIESPGYHRHLVEVLISIERSGFAIVLGRGANFVLRQALNVRLKAPLPARIKRVMEQMNVSAEEAKRIIRESDKQRSAFVKQMFNHHIDDEDAYDLIIHSEEMTPQGIARIIHTALLVKYPDLEKPSTVYALVQKV